MYLCVCEFTCIFVFGCVCVQKMVSDEPRQASWARGLDDTSSTIGLQGLSSAVSLGTEGPLWSSKMFEADQQAALQA